MQHSGWGAFTSDDGKRQARRDADARAASSAAEASRVVAAEAAHFKEAIDISSTKAYPTLFLTKASKNTLNFKGKIDALIEKEAREAAMEEEDEEPLGPVPFDPKYLPKRAQHNLVAELLACIDEIDTDEPYLDDEEEDTSEFNAETFERRGRR